jgi:hypothetical protein
MIFLAIVAGVATGLATKAWYEQYRKHDALVVSINEFKHILKQKGLFESFKNGELVCSISGEVITPDNLGYLELFSDGSLLIVSKDAIPSVSRMPKNQAKEFAYA